MSTAPIVGSAPPATGHLASSGGMVRRKEGTPSEGPQRGSGETRRKIKMKGKLGRGSRGSGTMPGSSMKQQQ